MVKQQKAATVLREEPKERTNMLEEPTDAVRLARMLFMDNPPEDDLDVVYGIETDIAGMITLHDPWCPQRRQDGDTKSVKQRRVKAWKLKQTLKNDRIERACMNCYGDQWAHVNRLLTCAFPYRGRPKLRNLIDCSLLLSFEAWNRTNIEGWSQWLCEATPDQIRGRAKRELKWGNNPDEPHAVVFDAGGRDEKSWVVGVGDHVTVTRGFDGGRRGTSVLKVHGFLPARLTVSFEEQPTSVVVPVGQGFSPVHFEVAVNLYETNRDETTRPHEETAQEAVQQAQLCLA